MRTGPARPSRRTSPLVIGVINNGLNLVGPDTCVHNILVAVAVVSRTTTPSIL